MNDPSPISFSPSLPDIAGKQPVKAYKADPYMLFLLEDVLPLSGGEVLSYPLVFAVIDQRLGQPVCFVTLENSVIPSITSTSNVLCVHENDGKHSNYGPFSAPNLKDAFVAKAKELVSVRFQTGGISELQSKGASSGPHPTQNWSNLAGTGASIQSLVKAALVMGAAVVVAVALWIYFSPYQTCVRNFKGSNAEIRCAIIVSGSRPN